MFYLMIISAHLSYMWVPVAAWVHDRLDWCLGFVLSPISNRGIHAKQAIRNLATLRTERGYRKMKALAVGVWGTSHWILDLIGRGAVRCFPANSSPSDDEAYSMTGGAVLGTLIGAVLGYTLSAESRGLSLVGGALIGSLVGITTGIGCGAIVQSVDDYIRAVLNSLKSQ